MILFIVRPFLFLLPDKDTTFNSQFIAQDSNFLILCHLFSILLSSFLIFLLSLQGKSIKTHEKEKE